MIRDIVAAGGFAAFVAAGIAAAFLTPAERAATAPPPRVRVVVAIGLALSLLAGLSRRELWPFATWALMPGTTPADVRVIGLVCADADGRSFAVDHRAWGPLTEEELFSWVGTGYTRLSPARQDSARAALLRMAESARERVRAGGSASPRPSPLGPLAAASHLRHPDRWQRPDDAPATPCVALRLVERSWNVDSVAAGRSAIAERTIWEYRP